MENRVTVNATSGLSDTRLLRVDDAIERVILDKKTRGKVTSVRRRSTREKFVVKTVVVGKDDPGLPELCLSRQRLREIRLLRLLRGHFNIVALEDLGVDFRPDGTFDQVHLYLTPMEADLSMIIRSRQPLTDSHYQSILYQTFCGLKYIHSAGIIHAGLDSSNIVVNADCHVRICDLGNVQIAAPKDTGLRWWWSNRQYRAPELHMKTPSKVISMAADIWSAGCVLAALMTGKSPFSQLTSREMFPAAILSTWGIGSITEAGERITGTKEFVLSNPLTQGLRFEELFPDATPLCLDLISQLLRFDAQLRPTADEALKHPYFSVWYEPADELTCPKVYVEDFDICTREEIQKLIVLEVESLREERKTFFNPSSASSTGYSAPLNQTQSSETSSQTSWANLSEDNNLHYERALSPVGNDNLGSLVGLCTGSE